MIEYEHPLNERVRTWLRIEDLYARVTHFVNQTAGHSHHVALVTLFELMEVVGRADLKSDLLQELERQRQALEHLRGNPAVDESVLVGILEEIEYTSRQLHSASGKAGQDLRENEWLMSIKQRAAIPGGSCEFDLPFYHYWLHQAPEIRQRDLHVWTAPFQMVQMAANIILRLLRESGRGINVVAQQGSFQQMLAGRTAQLIKVTVHDDLHCIPEISANKYALNVRFIAIDGMVRSKTCEHDVPFELTFCNL